MGMCAPKIVIYRSAHSKMFGDNWAILTFYLQKSYY